MTRVVRNKKRPQSAMAKEKAQPALLQWRYYLVLAVVLSVFLALCVRAAYIQVIEPDRLIREGDARTLRNKTSMVQRGMITDRNGQELAVSIPVKAIWADPKRIHELGSLQDERRWQALAQVLGQPVKKLKKRVANPKKRFVYLQRQLTPAIAEFVEKLDIGGVYLRNESRRYYPAGEVSAHIVGFTDVDDKGLEGIERLYNKHLTGTPDTRKIRRDAKGRQVEILEQQSGTAPKDVRLTIDQRIQALAYREVKRAVNQFQATSVSAVVADVDTGEILALVNNPSYNPNDRSGISAHRMRNRAITDAFEPGSSVKPLAVLAALEFGSVTPESKVNTSPGWMRVGGKMVTDGGKNNGELALWQIIQKSSNVGTSKLVLSMPKEHFLEQFYAMGLVSQTSAQLLGESDGIFHYRARWSDFELSTLSFGYGLSVTAVQLTRMYSVLGSGGIKRPLRIVMDDTPTEAERVVSEANARQLLNMMESVVTEGGSGHRAVVEGYRVAGKTGTSRKAVAGGYGEEYVNIFVGVAPVSDPKLVVTVLVNEPGGDLYHGGETAAPVFSRIMGTSLQLLNISPDAKPVSSVTMGAR